MSRARGRTHETEDLILKLCEEHPNGVTQELIQSSDPSLTANDITAAINPLMTAHRLEMLTDGAGMVVWRARAAAEATKYKGLTREEALIYQHIEQSGNQGLWTRDMKQRTNLQQPQITKILKQLESRKLVKVVKSVAQANRKVYMKFDVEPSREITGGAWYTDHSFDAEFIEMLRKVCVSFIQRQDEATLDQIASFMREKKLTNEQLSNDDYGMILNTLCLDGEIERLPKNDAGEDRFVIASQARPTTTALTSMPCGICPVAGDCTPDGAISPATCVYFKEWLY